MSRTKSFAKTPIEFIQFWSYIASQLGSSRLKINPKAHNIHNLFDADNDSKDFIKQAIIESYKRSQCNNLSNQISVDIVLDILGEIAYELRNNHLDDLFDMELLEEIAWHINDRYRQHLDLATQQQDGPTGIVVSFPQYKIRIANART